MHHFSFNRLQTQILIDQTAWLQVEFDESYGSRLPSLRRPRLGNSEAGLCERASDFLEATMNPEPSSHGKWPVMSEAKVCLLGQTNPAESCNLRYPSGAAMFSEEAWGKIARSLKLSGRELQIVREVFDDHTEFTIANHLNLSPHTIHTHCERLYHKLAVTDRVKLVLRVTNEFFTLTFAPESNLPPICADQATGRCPLQRNQAQNP